MNEDSDRYESGPLTKSIHVIWLLEPCYTTASIPGSLRWRSYPDCDPSCIKIFEWFVLNKNTIPELLHYNNDWLYIASSREYAILLVAADYRPNVYSEMVKNSLKLLQGNKEYFVNVVQYYIAFCIKQVQSNRHENGFVKSTARSLECKSKIEHEAYNYWSRADRMCSNRKDEDTLTGTGVQSLVKWFGMDIILLYTALLLRKRIIVYDHSMETTLKFVDGLLGLNYDDSKIIVSSFYPNIDMECSLQSDLLREKSNYIAASMTHSFDKCIKRYDIFVNLPAHEILVSPLSKQEFNMTKVHKDIANTIVRIAEHSAVDSIAEQITNKTDELMRTVEKLITDINIVDRSSMDKLELSNEVKDFYWSLITVKRMLNKSAELGQLS